MATTVLAINEGLVLVNKPRACTSFDIVRDLRRLLNVKKVGHTGTLDPFATGLLVMLVGRKYTRLSDQYLNCDKEYIATVQLGITTDSYDCDGKTLSESDLIPSHEELEAALSTFQGTSLQTPPMFSAKKINGKKLYQLAREGIEVERKPVEVTIQAEILEYTYPYVKVHVQCSKGTYIRSIAHDLGQHLACGAILSALERTRCGPFHLSNAIDGLLLKDSSLDLSPWFITDAGIQ